MAKPEDLITVLNAEDEGKSIKITSRYTHPDGPRSITLIYSRDEAEYLQEQLDKLLGARLT